MDFTSDNRCFIQFDQRAIDSTRSGTNVDSYKRQFTCGGGGTGTGATPPVGGKK